MDPIIHPVAGPLKLGRKMPNPHARRVMFGAFLRNAELPAPPAETSYSPLAQPCLDQILLNDKLGCCTTATAMHLAAVILGDAGASIKFSNAQVQDFYSLSTGYKPGHPNTDNGGDEITVLDCWRKEGLGGGGLSVKHDKVYHNIAGHLSVNGADLLHTKTALATFSNLYFGCSLPDAWLSAHNGMTLDASHEPNFNNGHAFAGVNYDQIGVWCVLWGGIKVRLTWAAIARYTSPAAGGELHAVVSKDALVKGTQKTYHGLDWAAIDDVFTKLGGTIAT